MARRDEYYNKAKQEGYRSRAAYKLKQLDESESLIRRGDTVIDLGAAPGGWLQVAAGLTGPDGRVIGVDRQRIDPIEGVDTIRGDLTKESTKAEIREAVGEADVVLSDMAPNMTGEYTVDHARSIHLARQAAAVALDLLAGGGTLVVKVFDGSDLAPFREELAADFDRVRTVRPPASRDESSEVYLVAAGRLTAPVSLDETVEVEIVDIGSEGDGVAKVDGFTLFVPETEVGDELTVRVTDLAPRFGAAEPAE